MPATRDPQVNLSQFHWNDAEHQTWNHSFSEQVRCCQVAEDLFAARTVTGVLITIVAMGAALGALAVVLTLLIPS